MTRNYVGVDADTVYVAGAMTGNVIRPVAKIADLRCAINPSCNVAPAPQTVIAAPASDTVPASSYVNGVNVSLAAAGTISGDFLQGDALPTATLTANATGNLQPLAGRAIYVVVVDPHGLFETQADVSLGGATAASASLTIRLRGKRLSTSGVFQGSLKVYGCLDAACSVQFAGTPFSVPYNVSVWPAPAVEGLALDRMPVVLLPFGQSETRRYGITLPPYTTSWSATVGTSASYPTTDPYPADESSFATGSDTSSMGNTSGTVTVNFRPAVPGIYGVTLRVQGTMNLSGRTLRFSRDYPFSYRVTASSTPEYVISPAQTVVSCKVSDCELQTYRRIALANSGVTLAIDGVEYTSPRVTTAGNACLADWWAENKYFGATVRPRYFGYCAGVYDAPLPPGTYTARVRYKLTRGGVVTNVYHPVTLVIVP